MLISVDTLRADHLGIYGSQATRTPNIDRFAGEASVFDRAAAPMPLTRPSHFSIFTSLYPREHGVLNNAIALPDSAATLAEIFAAHGYRTAAFVGVSLLGDDSGATQGFQRFDSPTQTRERPAEEVVTAALRWLGGLRHDERFFLWVHLFDPHLPYAPPQAYRSARAPELAAGLPSIGWSTLREVARRNHGDIPRAVFERAKALYAGEVEYVDHWVGQLLDGLVRVDRLESAVAVFTADHGESFESGVFFEHADSLLEATIRVPLIVRHPPIFSPGARIATQVSSIDIAPTLLEAAGIEIPPSYSGRALQWSREFGERYVLVQHPFYQPRAIEGRSRKKEAIRSVAGMPIARILMGRERSGVVGPSWKYLRSGATEELYRMSPVSDEQANRVGDERAVRRRLERILDEELGAHPLTLIAPAEINEELLETLRALGYTY